jgi:hypothetical protein
MARNAALLALIILPAGCGGGSIMPGHGTIGGLGTVGTDTANPDEALVFHLKGSAAGDFVADTVRPVNNRTFEARQEVGPATSRTLRVVNVSFSSVPVANHTYTVGAASPDGVTIRYTEQRAGNPLNVWRATKGSAKVKTVSSERIRVSFSAALTPDAGTTGNLTLSDGEMSLKF